MSPASIQPEAHVYLNPEDAKARFDYLDKISKSASMFAEFHYLNGTVIVRVSKSVKPSLAAKVEAAVKALKV